MPTDGESLTVINGLRAELEDERKAHVNTEGQLMAKQVELEKVKQERDELHSFGNQQSAFVESLTKQLAASEASRKELVEALEGVEAQIKCCSGSCVFPCSAEEALANAKGGTE